MARTELTKESVASASLKEREDQLKFEPKKVDSLGNFTHLTVLGDVFEELRMKVGEGFFEATQILQIGQRVRVDQARVDEVIADRDFRFGRLLAENDVLDHQVELVSKPLKEIELSFRFL